MSGHDINYYRERAEIELRNAQAATCEAARKVHYTLAGHYLNRVAGGDLSAGPPPPQVERM